MMSRSILRCVDCIILSCSLVGAHVLDALHIVGVIAASNSQSRCLSMSFFDVSSCLYLWNVAQAALIRFFISVVSCCRNVIVWPKYLTLSPLVSISFFMSSTSFFLCVRALAALVAENFRLFWMTPETHFFSTSLEFAQHFLKLFFGGCKQERVVGRGRCHSSKFPYLFFLLSARDVVFQCFL